MCCQHIGRHSERSEESFFVLSQVKTKKEGFLALLGMMAFLFLPQPVTPRPTKTICRKAFNQSPPPNRAPRLVFPPGAPQPLAPSRKCSSPPEHSRLAAR